MADDFKGINQETLKNVELLKGSMKEIAEATAAANKQLQQQGRLIQDYRSNFSSITTSASQFAKLQDEASKSASATSKALSEQQKQLSNVRSLNAQIENLMDQMVNASKAEEKLLLRQVNNLSAARDNAKELANAYEELVDSSSKLDKSTMWFSAFSEVVKDIPGLRKLSSPFELAAKAARETAINNAKIKTTNENIASLGKEALKTGKGLTKEKLKELGLTEQAGNLTGSAAARTLRSYQQNNKVASTGIAGMQVGFKALGPIIKGALGPLAIITTIISAIKFFVEAMFEADEQVTNIAKSFNTTKEDSRDIRKSFSELSDDANNFGKIQKGNLILQKDLVSANLQLNELLGTSVDLSSSLGNNGKELAIQFADASKFLKLGADEQKGLLGLTASTGKNIDNIKNSVLGTTRLRKLESGILLDERKILKDVLIASNAIKLSVKGGAEGLTKAAFAAAELGSDLNKVEAISKSLLNFEDSISAEMEAELLTGRNLNLETARRAALNGDIETVAKEINKQIGTSADFTKMNVIQQEALAKAMGTSRGELADMLVQQESLNSLKGTFNALGKETIENLKKSGKIDETTYKNLISGKAAATDYFDALQKSGMKQEEIVKLLGDEAAASLESQTAQEKFNDVLEKAKETFTRFIDGGYLDKLANVLAGITDRGILQSLTSTEEETSGYERLKSKGYTIEEGSGLFGTGAFKKTKIFDKEGKEIDSAIGSKGLEGLADIYAPKEKTESADDFILRPGQPLVKLNKNDLVIGGTNLNGGGNAEVTVLLKELINAVKTGGSVYLDGNKVGTAMSLSTFRAQ